MAEETRFAPNAQTAPGAAQAGNRARPSLRDIVNRADENNQDQNRIGNRQENENRNRTQGERDRVAITEEARQASRAEEARRPDQQVQNRAEDRRNGRDANQPAQTGEADRPSLRDLTDTAGAAERFGRVESGLASDRNLAQEAQNQILPERIARKNVTEAVQAQLEKEKKAEAAKEPLLETPKQVIEPPGAGNQTAGAGENARTNEANRNADTNEQPRQGNPAALQTEIGQNVDRLI